MHHDGSGRTAWMYTFGRGRSVGTASAERFRIIRHPPALSQRPPPAPVRAKPPVNPCVCVRRKRAEASNATYSSRRIRSTRLSWCHITVSPRVTKGINLTSGHAIDPALGSGWRLLVELGSRPALVGGRQSATTSAVGKRRDKMGRGWRPVVQSANVKAPACHRHVETRRAVHTAPPTLRCAISPSRATASLAVLAPDNTHNDTRGDRRRKLLRLVSPIAGSEAGVP